MAATGKTPILLYGSTTATNTPSAGNLTNSSDGCEIAINVADKNLFFKDATNTVNTVPIRQSSASSDGWLSSTDWSTFNSKQPAGTYVTSVTGTAPVVSSGGTTPAISMAAATGSTNGYLTSTDWTTFNNKVSSQWTTSGSYIYYNTNNVGIGTATPTVASGLGLVLNGGAGQTRLAFKNNTTGDAAGDGVQLALVSTGFIYQNRETGGYHSFEIDGVEYLQVASTGNINVPAGNLVIGTSGKGIDFSATAGTGTSELLADYEEGTWTPTLTNCGASASVADTNYVKVGNVVTARLTINTGTFVANSSRFTLPFSSVALSSGTFTNGTTTGGFIEAQASTTCYFATASTGNVNITITYITS